VLGSEIGKVEICDLFGRRRLRIQRWKIVKNSLGISLGAEFFKRLSRFIHRYVEGLLV